jgi:hypothetical protein
MRGTKGKTMQPEPESEGSRDTRSTSAAPWVSNDDDVSKEIDEENRQYLRHLEESQKGDRLIVGWRPK